MGRKSSAKRRGSAGSNRFRIIGGRWRGRRLVFPSGKDLRPTGDRVRETLFNWLAPVIEGARCLDLYAGSGALGLEALSRGAATCVFVDVYAQACEAIDGHLTLLEADGGQAAQTTATGYLRRPPRTYDVVFLDPPFSNADLPELCTLLESEGWLAEAARVYIECPASSGMPLVPDNWTISRSGRAGNVGFFLCVRS